MFGGNSLVVPHVVIDLRMVAGPLHGIARYALELARRIPELEPGWRFSGLVGPQGLPPDLGTLAPRIPLVRCAAPFLAPLEQPALAAALRTHRPDLFHATSFSVPRLWTGRLVATVHDAIHLSGEASQTWLQEAYYRLVVIPRCRTARGLITVSQYSARELTRVFGLPEARWRVISNGVAPEFRPVAAGELEDFRARRSLPERFFLAIGSTKPHKNLGVLSTVAETLPLPLVLLAGRGARRLLHFSDRVIELAPLPDADLVRLYSAAEALLFPSRAEGFGLPALEAMAAGTAVICADAGALPETTGDAALRVPATDPISWRAACERLHRDAGLRASLVERGLLHVQNFTWDRCARQTLETYRAAMA